MRAVPLAPARDYKRIGEGDTGPNTGGMGCFSPVPLPEGFVEETIATVHQPVVDELARAGTPFHGVLYAGLMLTDAGTRVLEFNVRFGDPETQVVLPRLRSDLLDLLVRACEPGGLEGAQPEWDPRTAVTVVLASGGYPESSSSGDVIEGLDAAGGAAEVVHAGTAERDGAIVTAGGRVLNVTALGDDLASARTRGLCCRRHDHFRRPPATARHRCLSSRRRRRWRSWPTSRPTRRASGSSWAPSPTWRTMEKAGAVLDEYRIRWEIRVMSAHRDPEMVADYCKNARMRGLRVIIAGAGISAALPGVAAAHTDLPVIGVPLTSSLTAAGGLDAILSIVQMPPGVPVAAVGLDNPRNAAHLAARILTA